MIEWVLSFSWRLLQVKVWCVFSFSFTETKVRTCALEVQVLSTIC